MDLPIFFQRGFLPSVSHLLKRARWQRKYILKMCFCDAFSRRNSRNGFSCDADFPLLSKATFQSHSTPATSSAGSSLDDGPARRLQDSPRPSGVGGCCSRLGFAARSTQRSGGSVGGRTSRGGRRLSLFTSESFNRRRSRSCSRQQRRRRWSRPHAATRRDIFARTRRRWRVCELIAIATSSCRCVFFRTRLTSRPEGRRDEGEESPKAKDEPKSEVATSAANRGIGGSG